MRSSPGASASLRPGHWPPTMWPASWIAARERATGASLGERPNRALSGIADLDAGGD